MLSGEKYILEMTYCKKADGYLSTTAYPKKR